MNKVTPVELVASLRSNNKCEIVTMDLATDPKLLKRGNPYKGRNVLKHSTVNGLIGFDYESCVNKQLTREEAEAEFVSKPRQWGKRVDTKTVEHKGSTYLSLNCQSTKDVFYTVDGERVDSDLIKPFLPKKSASRQGTEKEVIYRDVKVESVKAIAMRGERNLII